jgi:hypothetical protein
MEAEVHSIKLQYTYVKSDLLYLGRHIIEGQLGQQYTYFFWFELSNEQRKGGYKIFFYWLNIEGIEIID